MTSTEKTYTGPRLPGMTPGKPANYLRWSAIALIGISGVLLALYLFFIASDQYVSEARFGLRAGSQMQQASANRDGHSSMGSGAMATELFVDSFAVVDYVKSRQIVQELDKELNLREMWSKPMIDFWYGMNQDETEEGLWRQWNRMVDIEFDMSTGAIILRVRAFSPEESLQLAQAILQASEKLVNQMSAKSREDSVDFARVEVGIAESAWRRHGCRSRTCGPARACWTPSRRRRPICSWRPRCAATWPPRPRNWTRWGVAGCAAARPTSASRRATKH